MKISPQKLFLTSFFFAFISSAAQAEEIKVGIIGSTTDAPIFIADANGYFRDEGISVALVPFASGAQMSAPLATGELSVATGAVSASLYNAVNRGITLKIVADKSRHAAGFGHASILVREDLKDKIRSFADLKGLKIAVSGRGSGDESVLNEALRKGNLKWSDAEPVYLGFPQHAPAFANKAIDAALTSEPAQTYILKAGTAVRMARVGEFYPDQQSAAIIYGTKFANSNPQVAIQFMKAYVRGTRFYADAVRNGKLNGPNAARVIEILTTYSNLKDKEIYENSIPPIIDPDGQLNIDSLKKDWAFFKETGEIDGKISVDEVVDTSYVKKAVELLGPYRPASP